MLKKQQNKLVTCAVLIKCKDQILIAHPTNSRFLKGWSFPKGLKEDSETEAEAACREVKEETGLIITPESLTDLGRFPYTKEKDYHLFTCDVEKIVLEDLFCESMFIHPKKKIEIAEVDSYMLVNLEDAISMFLNVKQAFIVNSVKEKIY